MHRIKHIAIIFCLLVALPAVAQFKSDLVQSRILILLDESSSMVQKWNGDKAKYAAAHEIILRIMDSVYAYNADVEFSLRVFGHQHTVQENDCHDTRNEVAFSKGNRNQMDFRLTDIHPLGVTPIAYALSQAAEYDLVDELHNAYSIILITDGGESCGGDICEVMRTLIANKVFFKPYIVGLEDAPELRSSYACMGNFLSVTKEGDVPDAVSKIVTGFKPIIKVTKSEYKEIKELSANVPSILKVNPPRVAEVPPPAPAPHPVAKVTSINHLVIATEKLSELPIAEPDKLKVAAVPAPPADIVAIPTAPQIEHILNASIHELPGATLQLVPVRKAVIPDVIEPIELPATNSIDHILPASLKELILTTVAPRIVSVQAVPFITELKLDHPELPKVTSINHLSPAYHNYVLPAPEQVSVRKRQPEPVVITEAPQLPAVSPISHIAAAKISVMDHAEASVAPLPLVKPLSPPAEERETASLPVVAKINHIKPAGSVEKDNTPVAFAPLVKVANNVPEVDIKDVPSTERISRQKPAKMMEPRVIFIIEDHPLKLRTPPDPPSFTPMPSAALLASKPSLAPAKPPVGPGVKSTYTVETVDAKETGLMVYFTNGHGKFYETTPQVVLLEPFSNKIMKKFYRTLDPAGVPDVVKDVPAGTFNIAIAEKRNLVLYDVEIVANKLTKVICTLKNCSLAFEYDSAAKRPMTEFMATVIQRNVADGKVINQKCTQKLEYEPGSYHIVIHTYPQEDRYIDLDFDDTKIITLPQPGFIKITTELKNRKLNLYKPVNDKFLQFDSKNSSDTSLQHLMIQPGQYQIRYLKDPTKPYSKETVIPVSVRPNRITEVELPK